MKRKISKADVPVLRRAFEKFSYLRKIRKELSRHEKI